MQDTTQNKSFASLLYWRRSKWNGLKCKPAIIKIDENNLVSLKDYDGNVQFSVPAPEISARFTTWGTMILDVNNFRYEIVGTGASVSPDPKPEQIEEIKEIAEKEHKDNSTMTRLGSAGAAMTAASPVAGVAGTAAMTVAYYQGLDAIKDWQKLLITRGAQVDQSKMQGLKTFVKYALIAVLLFVGFFAIVGILRNY